MNFSKDVVTLYNAMPCNPFEMDSLCALNNSDPFPQTVIDKLKQVLPRGEEQVKLFIEDRLLMQKVPINGKITKNNFPLLKVESTKSSTINLGVPFMNKLQSAVVHRPSLADKSFAEELYGVPHCFSVDGTDEMYHGTKSSIKDRLKSSATPIKTATSPKAIITEASPLIRKLSGVSVDNFHEFAVVFYNHVVVEIGDDISFPQNFLDSFLCNSENKHDLGLYLASKLISIHWDVGTLHLQLCVTYKANVISLPSLMNHSPFQIESTAEEADQKIVRHTLHCINEEYTDIEIQSIDIDVPILLLAYVAIQMESSNNHAVNVFFQTRNTQSHLV